MCSRTGLHVSHHFVTVHFWTSTSKTLMTFNLGVRRTKYGINERLGSNNQVWSHAFENLISSINFDRNTVSPDKEIDLPKSYRLICFISSGVFPFSSQLWPLLEDMEMRRVNNTHICACCKLLISSHFTFGYIILINLDFTHKNSH
jgi:hypothetical protein